VIVSTEQAIDILQDTSNSETEREHAIHFLQEHESREAIDALVAALEDDDYGVRWAAGSGLAQCGESAMPSLLKALIKADNDSRLREGSVHIFHNSASRKVREDSTELLEALKGPSAAIASMEAAYGLMEKWDIR
jgi:HEAT repeat protein